MTLIERTLREVLECGNGGKVDVILFSNVRDVVKMIEEGKFEIKTKETKPIAPLPLDEKQDEFLIRALLEGEGASLKAFVECHGTAYVSPEKRKEYKARYQPLIDAFIDEGLVAKGMGQRWFMREDAKAEGR